MYDSTNPFDIPQTAEMVAGYIDGVYVWPPAGWARFAGAKQWRIAVSPFTNAGNVLDVEAGAAAPSQAPGWVTMRRAAGIAPIIYVQASSWASVRLAFAAQRVPEPFYWIASYDGDPTIPAGAIAKQYADQALIAGHPHYDLSNVDANFGGGGSQIGEEVTHSEKRAWSRLAYVAGLGREPESDAVLEDWASKIADDGSNVDSVIASIIDSPEGVKHLASVRALTSATPVLVPHKHPASEAVAD